MTRITRKSFFTGIGALAVGTFASGKPPAVRPTLPKFDSSQPDSFWRAVLKLYNTGPRRTYLNTAGLGPVTTPVLELTERKRRELQLEAETGRHSFDDARAVAARFLGASTEEVAFTRNATEGNSIIAAGLRLVPGDEVIFESHAHPGGSFPWLNRQLEAGIRVRVFEPSSDSVEENLERIRRLITTKTRVIQVSHITAPTGILLPVPEVAALAAEHTLWLHVDAAQSLGAIPIDVRALGCDSLASSGHKWIGGPHETGVLYIKKERLPEVALSHAGAYSDAGYELPDKFALGPNASRFEYGTRDAGSVAGLAAAMELQERIGRNRIAARGRQLAALAASGLLAIPGVEVISPGAEAMRTAITTFRIAGMDCHDVFSALLRDAKLRCRPVTEQGLNAIRVSPHIFNSEREIEKLVRAVDTIARRRA